MSGLANHIEKRRFRVLDVGTSHFKHELVQLCTNTYLMALQEILRGIKRNLGHEILDSVAELELALYRLTLERSNGIVYNWSPVSLLAQSQE